MQEVPPAEPIEEGNEGAWETVGNRLEVIVQPPPLKNFWRNWSTSPLLQKRAEDPWPPLLERWWPQECRRRLRRPPPPWRRQ
jgi:hypothetical protein